MSRCSVLKYSIQEYEKNRYFYSAVKIKQLGLNKNQFKNSSDTEIIALYKQSNNLEYVALLFERYTHLIYGVCLKYLKDRDQASDALMQVFEKITAQLKKHEVENFKSWLYSVAKNLCLMQLRSASAINKHHEEIKHTQSLFMENPFLLHPDSKEDKEKILITLEKCIQQLNNNQKLAIELFYLQELCYTDVATKSGFTMNEVKSHIQNGKRNLKICLEANA